MYQLQDKDFVQPRRLERETAHGNTWILSFSIHFLMHSKDILFLKHHHVHVICIVSFKSLLND